MMDFTAGYDAYVTGANYQLQDQFLFGSSYPVVSLRQAVENTPACFAPKCWTRSCIATPHDFSACRKSSSRPSKGDSP